MLSRAHENFYFYPCDRGCCLLAYLSRDIPNIKFAFVCAIFIIRLVCAVLQSNCAAEEIFKFSIPNFDSCL